MNIHSLNVLVVDDTNLNRQLMQAMLKKMGHRVILAEGGVEALDLCSASMPDLVLLDVSMPGMSGFEVAVEMRQRYSNWFPIVFLSALSTNADVVEGLRAGGDDYMFKPVNYEILQAKINMFQIRIEQNLALQAYSDLIIEENKTAGDFIKQFTALDQIQDPLVNFFLKPAESFSGDVIAVARRPDNCLQVLLADSAGHGLTAALAVIPITKPFYQMTAKGFDIQAIVRELNSSVHDYLPLPRFVAAAMISFEPDTGNLTVWNGGCPSPLLLTADGTEILKSFKSRHLPLGVLSPDAFDDSLEYGNVGTDAACLLMCSDGATEIKIENTLLGHQGLLAGARLSSSEHLFDRLRDVIETKLDHRPPADDIALIVVDCPGVQRRDHPVDRDVAKDESASQDSKGAAALCGQGCESVVGWEFALTLTASQLKRLDIIPFLLSLVGQLDGGGLRGQLFLVISELFNNALDHGVLKLDSKIKNKPNGLELFYAERALRLEQLNWGQIVIRFEKLGYTPCGCLKIHIKDSGDGFDYEGLFAANSGVNLQTHGRGISLLRGICSVLKYEGCGSEVTAVIQSQPEGSR